MFSDRLWWSKDLVSECGEWVFCVIASDCGYIVGVAWVSLLFNVITNTISLIVSESDEYIASGFLQS